MVCFLRNTSKKNRTFRPLHWAISKTLVLGAMAKCASVDEKQEVGNNLRIELASVYSLQIGQKLRIFSLLLSSAENCSRTS